MSARNVRPERYNIRVLDRAISVLRLLADGQPRTLTEVNEALRMSSSTTFRLLSSLLAHGLLARDEPSARYRLGLGVLELARTYVDGNDMRRVALPELERLRDVTGETVHLSVLEGMEVVYLEKLPGLHAIGIMSSRVGGRSPAYCTGLGKILLAYQAPDAVREHFISHPMHKFTQTTIVDVDTLLEHLKQVRDLGYALDRREHELEVECVAAPVFDMDGQVVAAISVSGPAERISREVTQGNLSEHTRQSALAISTRLGYRQPSSNSRGEEFYA
jgi:DNA-binding IclR family transcriptional regulator